MVNLDARIDASALNRFAHVFPKEHAIAKREAIARGAATTRKFQMQFLASGGEGEWERPAPLTRVIRRKTPAGAPALAYFSKLVAFAIEGTAEEPFAIVGHSPFKSKNSKNQPSMGRIEANYGGFSTVTTKEKRKQLVLLALRATKGIGGSKRGRTRIVTTKTLTEEQKRQLHELAAKLPRIGTTTTTPARKMPQDVAARYGAVITAKMIETYMRRLTGGLV